MSQRDLFKAYKVTNALNGRAYIGITKQEITRRWRFHLSWAGRGLRGVLASAIRKYGEAAFVVEHLASAKSWDDLCATEILLIVQERTSVRDGGYNRTQGGEGSLGNPHTAEARAKIAAAKTGLTIPEAIRRKISLTKTGRKLSQEHRAKMVAAAALRPPPTPESTAKRAAAIKGQRRSVETRAKQAAIRRAWWASRRTRDGDQGRLEL